MGAATQIPVEDLLSREVIPTNVTSPSSGCVLAGVPGEFASDPDAVLARINEIRREACEEGVRNPSNGKPLTMDDYVPIKWSRDLEYIARIRAAESAFVVKHGRANGTKWNTLESPDGVKTYAENCSRNHSNSVIYGIDSWYEEKADWVNQTPGAETGHYTSMIRPSYEYVGLSTFLSDDFANCNTTVGEFTFESGLDESRMDFTGECIQMLEMTASNLSAEGEIVGDLGGEIGEKSKHLLSTKASFSYAGTVYLLDGVTWSSSDTSVVTISSDGETTIKGPGSAVIRASFGNGSITAEAEFVKRVEDSTIDLSPASFTYDGTEREPEVTVTYDGVKLTEGTDYTLSFSNNVNAGTAKVTVTGIGEYGGTAEKTFTIEKAEQPLACAQDKSIIEVGTILPFTVTGCQTTPSFNNWDPDIVSLDVAEGDVSGTITALKPGGAYIIVTTPENANYKSAYASIYIQVEKAGIYNADITVTDAVYDGTPKIPEVQVSFAGKILTEGTDYTATCGSNIDAGTYYVTIKGIGDYQYSTRKSYKILKAEQTFTAEDLSLHPYEQDKVTVTGAPGARATCRSHKNPRLQENSFSVSEIFDTIENNEIKIKYKRNNDAKGPEFQKAAFQRAYVSKSLRFKGLRFTGLRLTRIIRKAENEDE